MTPTYLTRELRGRLFHSTRVRRVCLSALLGFAVVAGIGCKGRHGDGSEHRTYYPDGRLETRTTPNGATFKYKFDKAGRLTSVQYPGDTVRFGYDAAGNLLTAEDNKGPLRFEWNEFGRMSKVAYPSGQTISYEYDPWGRISLRRVSDSHDLHYDYDILGRLVRVDDGRGSTEYEYGEGEVRRKLPNGVRSTYRYSAGGALIEIRHERDNGQIISTFAYSYSPDGRVVHSAEITPQGERQIQYTYDLVGRLVEVNGPNGKKLAYSYDSMGNRLSEVRNGGVVRYEYDVSGKLVRKGNTSYKYDNDGNLVSQTDGDRHITTTYEYDAADRLVLIRNGTQRIRYTYDALGNRFLREANGKTAVFVTDLSYRVPQVMAEYDASRRLASLCEYGTSRLGQSDTNGQRQFYLEDRLGSVRQIVDDKGEVVSSINYDPFGEPDSQAGSNDGQTFAFTGEVWDKEARLLYLRARYYAPATGRFISRDPLRGNLINPQSQNRYVYARNDPVDFRDSTGLQDDGGGGDWGGGGYSSWAPSYTVDPSMNLSTDAFVNNGPQAQIQWPQEPSLAEQAKSALTNGIIAANQWEQNTIQAAKQYASNAWTGIKENPTAAIATGISAGMSIYGAYGAATYNPAEVTLLNETVGGSMSTPGVGPGLISSGLSGASPAIHLRINKGT